MTSLGDVDGDGVTDLAVGVPHDDDGGSNRGAVLVLFLNADGTVKSLQKISDTEGNFTGTLDDNDWFGWSVTGLGDLDVDGVTDLAVGVINDDDGGAGRGAVWLLFLNADGSVKRHQKISDTEGSFTGTLDDNDMLGQSVASLGDVDGDGVTDLAVGANGDDDGDAANGAVWVLFLNADGTVKGHQKISDTEGNFIGAIGGGSCPYYYFGTSVANLGDLDGDGVTDLAVGAEYDDDGGSYRGAAWLLFLNGDGTVKRHEKVSDTAGNFTGALDENDWFGRSLTSLGDLDGDGVTDLAVGAVGDDDGGSNRGAVWVLFCSQTAQDFGDAPAPYATTIAADGARHVAIGPMLGASRDAELDGQPTAAADGDDVTGDDEDGLVAVVMPGRGYEGASIDVDVSLVAPATEAYLNAWIDFNGDGDWDDVGEKVAGDFVVVEGVNTVTFDVPIDAVAGDTFLRMRLTSEVDGGGQLVTGLADDGEVEDHLVTIDTPTYDDIVGRASSSGDWFVAKSDGTSFANEHWGKWTTAVTWSNVLVGDFTGDGKDDVVGRADSTGDWFVAKATDSGFVTEHWGKWTTAVTWDNIMVGDFNGDGKDDLVGRAASSGDWFVGRSTGTGFAMEHWGKWTTAVNWNHIQVGDFNGDGYDDLVGRAPSSGDWFVAKSSSTNFATEHWGKWTTAVTWSSVLVGDFTGDGKDDVVGRADSSGDWFTSRSTGSSFAFEHWGKWTTAVNWDNIMVGDFNGDGYDDLIGRAPSSGDWFVARSSSTSFVMEHWGKWTTAVNWSPILTGDFTGDGKDDLAARADSSGDWFVSRSTGTSLVFEHWGRWTTAVPWVDVQVGDFDGAGGSSSGSVAGPAHAAAALDQFWSDFGDDDEEEEPLVVDAVDLWLME